MADNSVSNRDDQLGSPKSEQAPRPTEENQTGSPERLAQQAQASFSSQRVSAGRKPLFRS